MKITVLTDDTLGAENIKSEHGLSMYIETGRHKILADAGQSGMFLENAEVLHADIPDVDILFLSHGHYDHTGGTMAFSAHNSTAAIYIRESASHCFHSQNPDGSGTHFIGTDPAVFKLPNIHTLSENLRIDEEVSIFSGVTGRRGFSASNSRLSVLGPNGLIPDDFSHEQYLVIETEGKTYLFSGCAHNGILNILGTFRELYGKNPDYVFSGFHYMKNTDYTESERQTIIDTANELADMGTTFFTCHCTSFPAYWLMKPIMGEKLHILCSGFIVNQ